MPSDAVCSMGRSQIWGRLEGGVTACQGTLAIGPCLSMSGEVYQDRRASWTKSLLYPGVGCQLVGHGCSCYGCPSSGHLQRDSRLECLTCLM